MKNLPRTACTRLSPWILSLLSPWRGEASIGSRMTFSLSPWRGEASIGSRMTVAMGAVVLALTACGDDITEQINANVGAVETSKDLPECTKDIAGQTAFVAETHEFLGCDGKEWQTLSANMVSVGDNVCTSTSLSDGTGFEIFCNGLSIGTVKNGAKGEKGDTGAKGDKGDNGTNGTNGKDGAPGTPGANGTNGTNGRDGSGCEIRESTALTATIACGSETFTMDLTGFVDVPAECDATQYEDCTGPMDNVDLSGVSQKGPFVIGTDVIVYELENGHSLKQTGKTFGGKIEKADGTFDIKTVKLKSTFAYIVADGFYRNEVTGENSASAIKLRAFTNLQGRSSANINLVTHLEYDRISNLVIRKDYSVANAKIAAEREIFNAFHIDNSSFGAFAEDFNILQEGDGNAALLAISALLQGDRSEAQLTALLASLSVDLGDNGVWDNKKERAQVADWAMKKDLEGGLAKIRANVEGWKLSDSKAPAFEAPFRNFWMEELEVPACTRDIDGRLFATKVENSSFYAKNDSAYSEGDSSLARLICDASGTTPAWRFATDIEKDTTALSADAGEGLATYGKINTGRVYVKEKGNWRRGTQLDYDLAKSCVAGIKKHTAFSAVSTDTTWYICVDDGSKLDGYTVPTSWRKATEAEADTAQFGIPENAADSIKQGHINRGHFFVYENNGWRRGTDNDVLLGKACLNNMVGKVYQINNQFYTCTNEEKILPDGIKVTTTWRESTADEADTLGWSVPSDAKDSVKQGNIDKTRIYVYENGWRRGTDLDRVGDLGACTLGKVNKVVHLPEAKQDEDWYKCDSYKVVVGDEIQVSSAWRELSAQETDTAGINTKAAEIRKNGDFTGLILKGNLTSDNFNYYVYESGKWRRADTLEIDTYDLQNFAPLGPAADSSMMQGLSGKFYVYDSLDGAWRVETSPLDHLYDLGGCTSARSIWEFENREEMLTESEFIAGEMGPNCFKLSNGELYCVEAYPRGLVKQGKDNVYYLCVDRKWRKASDVRLATYNRRYRIDEIYDMYVFDGVNYHVEADTFRLENESEKWSREINGGRSSERCGELDSNFTIETPVGTKWVCNKGYFEWDGNPVYEFHALSDYTTIASQRGNYNIVSIGNQMWVAQNLKYIPFTHEEALPPAYGGGSREVPDVACYSYEYAEPEDNEYFGRMCDSTGGAYYSPSRMQEACERLDKASHYGSGTSFGSFHLPSSAEWKQLFDFVKNQNEIGKALKSTANWTVGNGTDDYMFAVQPAGVFGSDYYGNNGFYFGEEALFYTSDGGVVKFDHSNQVKIEGGRRDYWYSVRCVSDKTFPLPPKNPNKY